MESLIDQRLTCHQKLQDEIQSVLEKYQHRMRNLRQEIA